MDIKQNIDIYNTLVTSDRGTITEYDIQECIDRYSNTLHNPEELYNNKSMLFNGLLRYIYTHKIRYVLPETLQHDYKLLDSIFINIYIPLTMYFNRVPSVNTFCNHLINIYIDDIYDTRTGTHRPSHNSKVNPITRAYIAKWDELCNTELIDYIVHTSSIGGIFRAKTKGFREEQTIKLEVSQDAPTLDTKQIDSIVNTELPELPE